MCGMGFTLCTLAFWKTFLKLVFQCDAGKLVRKCQSQRQSSNQTPLFANNPASDSHFDVAFREFEVNNAFRTNKYVNCDTFVFLDHCGMI